MSLWTAFQAHGGRLIDKWAHYFPIYERHFGRFVGQPLTFIEIGCGKGGSLQMWRNWLGPHACIVGLDVNPACKRYEEAQIEVRIGDQSDAAFLASVVTEFGPPDVVLDDGSHLMSHLGATFRYLYPRLDQRGVYMVEDLHTAYWPNYEGGLRRQGSFIELSKALIDELNADHSRGALAPTDFTRSTLSMHFYDSVAVFERGRTAKKGKLLRGVRPEKTP